MYIYPAEIYSAGFFVKSKILSVKKFSTFVKITKPFNYADFHTFH